MECPTLKEEKKLWKQGYNFVAGIDEAGRGPLAGPVVACAVVLKAKKFKLGKLLKIRDSKKLNPRKREEIYRILINHPKIFYGVAKVSEKIIDRINILQATKLAIKKAISILMLKLKGKKRVDFLILDGNFKIDKVHIPQKSIIKGDEKVLSCALASIIAKVERDKLMMRYHKRFPNYGFNRHKGYGTKLHYERLGIYGPSVIHRRTFNINGKIS